MSKSAGCPEWKEYLLALCDDARLDAVAARDRLETGGDYEGMMNDLVHALGENRFNLDFERDFKTPDAGAMALLPSLFDNAAVTTNFDRVLETAYAKEGRAFVEKVTGRGMANAFFRAIPAGERYPALSTKTKNSTILGASRASAPAQQARAVPDRRLTVHRGRSCRTG
jgi:hypothetical protein